eukprot:4399441-Alexandrium_andersonii.AAC.1
MASVACVSSVLVRFCQDMHPQASLRVLADDVLVRSSAQQVDDRDTAEGELCFDHMAAVEGGHQVPWGCGGQ